MVAQAPRLASFETTSYESSPRFVPMAVRTVKLLDLVTNRYHVGLLRGTDETGMTLDLPRAAGFRPGQRIRFVVSDGAALVSRQAMQVALVTGVMAHGTGQRLELVPLSELVAA